VKRENVISRRSLETAGWVSFAAANGAVESALLSNAMGTHVQYMEGVDDTVRASYHAGLHVDTLLGPINSNSFNVPVGPLHLGLNVSDVHFNPPNITGHAAEQAASLLYQFNNAIVGQTREQLTEHLIHSARMGAIAGAVLSYAGIRGIRHLRAKSARIDNNLESIVSRLDTETAQKIEKEMAELAEDTGGTRRRERKQRKLGKKLGMAAVAPLIVLTTVFGNHQLEGLDGQQEAHYDQKHLPACFTEQQPSTEDITVSGVGGDAVNLALYASCRYPKEVRESLKESDDNFKPAFAKYKAKHPWWFKNSGNITRVAHLSDFHCNEADAKYLLPDELAAADPDIIVNTGDTQTNSGHMPWEKTKSDTSYTKKEKHKCIPELAEAIKHAAKANHHSIDVINALGNHDAKRITTFNNRWVRYRTVSSKHPVETIDLGEVGTTEESITFVSVEDPENVLWSPPPETEKTNAALLAQAKKIAAIACKIKAETGEAPWVLAHREQATSAAIAEDCARVALSGHTHEDDGLKEITDPQGNEVLQHTAGSVSGAGIGITLYQKPQEDATFTEFYYDKYKEAIEGYTTPTIHIDNSVDIHEGEMPMEPTPWQDEIRIAPFIRELVK
jgi:predicted MPP superfamily phosphohydrolase